MSSTREPHPAVSIGGKVEGQNVVIGSTQNVHGDLTITVGPMPAGSEELRQTVQQQIEQLVEALKAVPAEHTDKVQEVKVAAEDAVGEATKDQPDKGRLRIRAESLRKAAENLGAIAPIVLDIAARLATTLQAIG
jgi:hypothetical protein